MSLPVVSHVDWFRVVRFVSFSLLATSGVGFFCKKRRWWIWRLVPPDRSNEIDDTLAMTAVAAVKAASSVAAEVATLSQVMLAIQFEGKICANDIVRALQAQSFKLIEAERMTRRITEEMDKRKQASAANGISDGKGFDLQSKSAHPLQSTWKDSFSTSGLVSSSRDKYVKSPHLSTSNSIPQSRSFIEVMAMLERGETPPGIKNINDKPPIPNQLPSVSYLQPKPKPWEKAQMTKSNNVPYVAQRLDGNHKQLTSHPDLR